MSEIYRHRMFQSTPPHGERPKLLPLTETEYEFQSTPPHGERLFFSAPKSTAIGFQSTPPHGERLVLPPIWGGLNPVSIHAPARGATRSALLLPPVKRVFQSTPPHGERLIAVSTTLTRGEFQSTPPHGERPAYPAVYSRVRRFQSTPPHGERRLRQRLSYGRVRVSIHAPARGATVNVGNFFIYLGSFNPRPRTGSDYSTCLVCTGYTCFNPRPRTGSDKI